MLHCVIVRDSLLAYGKKKIKPCARCTRLLVCDMHPAAIRGKPSQKPDDAGTGCRPKASKGTETQTDTDKTVPVLSVSA